MAAAVEVAQLVRGHPRLGDLAGRVAEYEPSLQPGPGSFGQGLRCSAQQPPDPVERVVTVPTAVQGVLLDAAANLIERGQGEAGDMEGVQHPHRAGQLSAQRGRISAEGVERGDLNTITPVLVTGRNAVA